jgi:hypothetical protein
MRAECGEILDNNLLSEIYKKINDEYYGDINIINIINNNKKDIEKEIMYKEINKEKEKRNIKDEENKRRKRKVNKKKKRKENKRRERKENNNNENNNDNNDENNNTNSETSNDNNDDDIENNKINDKIERLSSNDYKNIENEKFEDYFFLKKNKLLLNDRKFPPHILCSSKLIGLEFIRIDYFFYNEFYVYKYGISTCASYVIYERLINGDEKERGDYLKLLKVWMIIYLYYYRCICYYYKYIYY